MARQQPDVGVTLMELQRAAAREFGAQAPSYPTLVRWVRDGAFAAAAASRDAGRRRLYHRRAGLLIIQGKTGAQATAQTSVADQPQMQPEQARPNLGRSDDPRGPVAEGSTEYAAPPALLARLDTLEAKLSTVLSALDNLDATRKMMMVKADAEIALWKQRALAAEASVQKAAVDPLEEARRRAGRYTYPQR